MKKMILVAFIVGSGVCGWLVLRHHRRAAPPAADIGVRAMDQFQHSMRLDAQTEYQAPPLDSALREKLRREEIRQRPQEGRN